MQDSIFVFSVSFFKIKSQWKTFLTHYFPWSSDPYFKWISLEMGFFWPIDWSGGLRGGNMESS